MNRWVIEHNKILSKEIIWEVVDNNENVHIQEGNDYNTATSVHNYGTGLPNLLLIQQVCNMFWGRDFEGINLDMKYDFDDNKTVPSACYDIDESEQAILDSNELDKFAH